VTVDRRVATALAGIALVACLLAGQAVADARVPLRSGAQAGATMGRAGFAYLTGLRRFAALVLWNRLEPQYHGFYAGESLKGQVFLLPNLRVILMLDPQFIQAYYMAPWILRDNGLIDEAISLARSGVSDNPGSGLLHTALAQILYLEKRDISESLRQADLATAPDQMWADETEQWQSLKIIADIYRSAGLTAKAEAAIAVTKLLDTQLGGAPGFRDPDAQF
jgi:tetratricopeptide (TPR) repeat protein